jgi:hypothetical protein
VADLTDASTQSSPGLMDRPDARVQNGAVAAGIDPRQRSSYRVALEFDERAYLATYDDVILSLDTGEFETARQHFEQFGRREGRHAE